MVKGCDLMSFWKKSSENKKKKKQKDFLDIDFIKTSYGTLVMHRYKKNDKDYM